jgi:hypothetical protein
MAIVKIGENLMFKIEYQTDGGVIGWLHTEYPDPDDADMVAKRLVQGASGDIIRTTVVEQAGHVYSEWVTR